MKYQVLRLLHSDSYREFDTLNQALNYVAEHDECHECKRPLGNDRVILIAESANMADYPWLYVNVYCWSCGPIIRDRIERTREEEDHVLGHRRP